MAHQENTVDQEGGMAIGGNMNVPNILAPGTVVAPPRPCQIPKDQQYLNPATGKIQLRVSKTPMDKGLVRLERWVCQAEGINGVFQTTPLFVIERQRRRGYQIMDVSQDSPSKLANLSVDPNYFGVNPRQDHRYTGDVHRTVNRLGRLIDYKVCRENPKTKGRRLEATTIIGTASLRYPVVNGYADRVVYSIIQDHSVEEEENTIAKERFIMNTEKSPHFEALDKPIMEHIRDDIHNTATEHEGLKVLQSKRRFTNCFGRKLHRDIEAYQQKFHGRALRPSKKNLQIMDVSSGKVMLQVGRLNRREFALDFLPPYTPFQALGLFLAQMDAN